MSKEIKISDNLFNRLEEITKLRGYNNIEDLIEVWERNESELLHRQETVNEINKIREQILLKYGEMSDSTNLIREDRDSR